MNRNIIIIGFMGSGKTTVGSYLARCLNLNHIDLDKEIENKYNLTISEIFNKYGEKYFREIEHKMLEEICIFIKLSHTKTVLTPGGGIVELDKNLHLLKQAGFVIFLNPEFDIIFSRIQNDNCRPLVKILDKDQLKEKWLKRLSKYRSIADIEIKNTNVIDKILEIVKSLQDINIV